MILHLISPRFVSYHFCNHYREELSFVLLLMALSSRQGWESKENDDIIWEWRDPI